MDNKKMTNPNQPSDPLTDALGERISAYLDGELQADERAKMEQLLADDPAAQRLANELQMVGKACSETSSPAFRDLTSSILAEAQQRKAAGEGFVDRLEPEGEFGLPFGRSSRGWVWAGVAVAASLAIGFYGRPGPPPARPTVAQRTSPSTNFQTASFSPAVQQALPQLRRAMPQLRVVRIFITPERLEQLLAQRNIQVRPAADKPESASKADDQLMLVSAEGPRMKNLMDDLEKEESIFRVEADKDFTTPQIGATESGAKNTPTITGQVAAAPSVAIRFTVRFTPGQKPTLQLSAPQMKTVSHGRIPVLFVIQTKQPQ